MLIAHISGCVTVGDHFVVNWKLVDVYSVRTNLIENLKNKQNYQKV